MSERDWRLDWPRILVDEATDVWLAADGQGWYVETGTPRTKGFKIICGPYTLQKEAEEEAEKHLLWLSQ
jgi:hypothetical protein